MVAGVPAERKTMDSVWEAEFRQRMGRFGDEQQMCGLPVSVKVRVSSGCFHCEHSPRAYEMIDEYLRNQAPDGVRFEEHESGPELLVWLALGTAGITLAKSVVDLVTTIIKARSEGIRKGDHPSHPVELIVRNVGPDGKVKEERVLRFAPDDPVSSKLIEDSLTSAVAKLLPPAPAGADAKPTEPQVCTRTKGKKRNHAS
jgi:hypothetical protein